MCHQGKSGFSNKPRLIGSWQAFLKRMVDSISKHVLNCYISDGGLPSESDSSVNSSHWRNFWQVALCEMMRSGSRKVLGVVWELRTHLNVPLALHLTPQSVCVVVKTDITRSDAISGDRRSQNQSCLCIRAARPRVGFLLQG